MIKNGVSEETAFELSEEERMAWIIIIQEHEGVSRFNFDREEWVKLNG